MNGNFPQKAQEIMNERFNHDTLIALATANGTIPYVRAVNSYYQEGAFYVITDASSGKMKQIEKIRMFPFVESGLLHTASERI